MRDRLANELGLEPGPELREAQVAVLRGDTDTSADPPASALGVRFLRPHTEKSPSSPRSLRNTGSVSAPVAGVTGSPGVGKSTLAVRVAHEVSAHFPDGQLYVDLGGTADRPRDPGDVLTELLHALGITGAGLPSGLASRAALYRSQLAGRRVLVVLDDAASVSQVVPLLPADAGCAVLFTSRRRLNELPGARQVELQPFGPDEAAELLAGIAGDDRIIAQPDEAAAIARACGHLPLAIRVAGARLAGRGGWSLQVLRERLVDESTRLRELSSGELAVRASFDLSVRQLGEPESRAFVLLALLGPHEQPGWVVDALLDRPGSEHLLDGLVDANLLEACGTDTIGQPRYRLHDLLRCHALELADELPDRVEHAGTDAADVVAARGDGGALGYPSRSARPSSTPIRVAAPRTPARRAGRVVRGGTTDVVRRRRSRGRAGLDEVAWQLAAACVPFFDLHSHYEDWARTHLRALQCVRAAGNKAGEAALLRGVAQVHIYRDEFDDAEREMLAARELYRAVGDARGEGISVAGIGVT